VTRNGVFAQVSLPSENIEAVLNPETTPSFADMSVHNILRLIGTSGDPLKNDYAPQEFVVMTGLHIASNNYSRSKELLGNDIDPADIDSAISGILMRLPAEKGSAAAPSRNAAHSDDETKIATDREMILICPGCVSDRNHRPLPRESLAKGCKTAPASYRIDVRDSDYVLSRLRRMNMELAKYGLQAHMSNETGASEIFVFYSVK